MDGYVTLGVAAKTVGVSLNTYQEAFYLSRTVDERKGLVVNGVMMVPLSTVKSVMPHIPINLWPGNRFDRPGDDWLLVIDGRPVNGYPEYAATREGQIWSRVPRTDEERKGVIFWRRVGTSASVVTLANAEGAVSRSIHQVILETYIGPRPKGKEARHRNGDVTNNSLKNLCWGTHKDLAKKKGKRR